MFLITTNEHILHLQFSMSERFLKSFGPSIRSHALHSRSDSSIVGCRPLHRRICDKIAPHRLVVVKPSALLTRNGCTIQKSHYDPKNEAAQAAARLFPSSCCMSILCSTVREKPRHTKRDSMRVGAQVDPCYFEGLASWLNEASAVSGRPAEAHAHAARESCWRKACSRTSTTWVDTIRY